MTVQIKHKIASFQVVNKADVAPLALVPAAPAAPVVETMHEKMKRPEILEGTTYKIKSPNYEHALYLTINNAVLNADADHETRVPFEMFVASKNMDDFQWIVATTRIASAVFRKGGDVTFLVEELKSVFDPKGGYMKKGGIFMPSLVAEIGFYLEKHLINLGLIVKEVDVHQQAFLAEKRAAFEEKMGTTEQGDGGFPASAVVCTACFVKAKVVMDGCPTCLSCGDSKCGG